VGPGDLVIGISQSGETLDTLAAMRLARERGATVIAVTNVMGSQVTRDAPLWTPQLEGVWRLACDTHPNLFTGPIWVARAAWLPDPGFQVTKATPNRSLRAIWVDGASRLDVDFYVKGEAKSQVSLQHGKLPSAEAAAEIGQMPAIPHGGLLGLIAISFAI
jgi:hypothetical protein